MIPRHYTAGEEGSTPKFWVRRRVQGSRSTFWVQLPPSITQPSPSQHDEVASLTGSFNLLAESIGTFKKLLLGLKPCPINGHCLLSGSLPQQTVNAHVGGHDGRGFNTVRFFPRLSLSLYFGTRRVLKISFYKYMIVCTCIGGISSKAKPSIPKATSTLLSITTLNSLA